MQQPSADTERRSPLSNLEGGLLTSIPVLSALVFVIVAIKVFRVSGMETTTTVSIISKAETFALFRGVIVTLLPGFLEALTAASIWWWAAVLPRRGEAIQATARSALFSREAAVAWILTVTMFFTIAWPVFLFFFVPVTITTVVLYCTGYHSKAGELIIRMRMILRIVALTVGAVSLGLLTLTSTPWLPLQTITVRSNRSLTLDHQPLPHKFAAYVLSSNDHGSTLLVDHPRAVIEVSRDDIEPAMPLCVPHETRRAWKIRASQVVGIDANVKSPYAECPEAR
jgi:hypothetical protein